jgi:hypothetical protein
LIGFIGIPALWARSEPLEVSRDYRVPYALSEDYWTYRRLMEQIAATDRIPVVGDSFVWGEYVPAAQTFPSFLNSETNSDRFANVGLNGAHPLALCGLIQNYFGDLHDRPVLLHCNLLWMSSPERDLQSDKEVPFNHPRLVPQFFPRIASYHAPLSQRLAIVIDRNIPFFDLVTHVRMRDFEGQDLSSWSITNPYANPLMRLTDSKVASSAESPHDPVPWTRQGIERQDMPWLDLDASLQWRAWCHAAKFLRLKGDRVLIVIGPFNEHLLSDPSRQRYQSLKQAVEVWLQSHRFRYVAPALLPSDEYGDASHPLSTGYARLAKSIVADRVFQEWFKSR